MISIFLGAGFSFLGNVPLASQLFDEQPKVDVISRQRLLERVLFGWKNWHDQTGGTPEQYLAMLEANGGKQWRDATWYVALVIAMHMGHVRVVGAGTRQLCPDHPRGSRQARMAGLGATAGDDRAPALSSTLDGRRHQ